MARPPATRNGLIALAEGVSKHLISLEVERQDQMLASLLERNEELGGTPGIFSHLGEFFHEGPYKPFIRIQKKPVHPSLEEEATMLKVAREKLQQDHKLLNQGLGVIMGRCRDWQDVRDALPEVLVDDIAGIKHLSRSRPPGFLFQGNEALAAQYQRTVDLALSYNHTHRLLFGCDT